MKIKTSQEELIKEFFLKNPLRDIPHSESVKWLISEYEKRTGKYFADVDRGIRKLHQTGFLIKTAKGVYKYDPKKASRKRIRGFTTLQKNKIFKKDGYKCVICGKGKQDGIEIHADHIKPIDLGGDSKIENGQTLCAMHNFLKKNYKQTETGKKMFIRLYELAKKENDKKIMTFCLQILKVFDDNEINGHIEWKK